MPWTKGGQLAGVIVGNVDLTGSSLQSAIQLPHIGANGEYADLIDRQGTIIASTNISRVLTRSVQADDFGSLISRKETRGFIADRNDAAEPEIVAFFPLSRFVFLVPWGVAVRQMESEALIPAWTLQRQFYLVGMSILVVGLVFTWGLARSIVRPVAFLNESARKIASGNLADPVPVPGEDELGMLARSFDAMRQKLKASLDRIQEWNRELERTVQERTGELEVAREIEAELLRRLISAQEEERRRIARELHDDTSQSLTALVLTLDTISLSPTLDDKLKTRVAFMKSITVNLLEGIRQMIFDLRPAMLDDLGLVPAVSWYAEQRLKPSGVRVAVESSGGERRLPQGIEIALFRVAQEALTNIVKHAGAESALIAVDINDTEAFLEIEDDGRGFNPREATRPSEKGQGLGLLGMKERVAALGGTISISSREGHGTSVKVHIPLEKGTV
jgi:signal transduction histidine kinase